MAPSEPTPMSQLAVKAAMAVAVALVVAGCSSGVGVGSATVPATPTAPAAPFTTAAPTQPASPAADLPPNSRAIAAAEYGDDWPLTVDHGIVECRMKIAVVFTDPAGAEYAINGSAMDLFPEMQRIDESSIWRENPDDPELRVDISPILDLGLDLC